MDSTWRPERVVAGRYRLGSPVGEGAMGTVWQAQDLRLDRVVAIKQLRIPTASTPDETALARKRVLREARAAARLQHPHAVAVYDVATDDQNNPVLVMEYVPAPSLAAVLTEHGTLPVAQVTRIGAQIAAALAAGHAAGIVHRDIKPANILITGVTAKITDFGLARTNDDVTITGTGLLAGTPAFLAPETAQGEPPSPAADVFSLGATLYTAVEGTPPFGTADNAVAQLHRVAAGGAPPPRHAGALTGLLMAMLHDDPDARPTMGRVADTLTGPSPTRVDLHPLTPPSPAPSGSRSYGHIALVAVAALVAGLLTLLLITQLPVGRSDRGGTAAPAPTAPATSTRDPELLRHSVSRFYTLLADDPDEAWPLLGPAMRDHGRERFEKQWKDAKDLQLVGTPTVTGDTVVAEIEYTAESRGLVRETHRHTMLLDGDVALINSDEVLSSTVIAGDRKEKDDKDDKDKDDDGN